jgi:hypothetical protein
MTVHIGEVTSEVTATTVETPPAPAAEAGVWEERLRIEAIVERLARDRERTATGDE